MTTQNNTRVGTLLGVTEQPGESTFKSHIEAVIRIGDDLNLSEAQTSGPDYSLATELAKLTVNELRTIHKRMGELLKLEEAEARRRKQAIERVSRACSEAFQR